MGVILCILLLGVIGALVYLARVLGAFRQDVTDVKESLATLIANPRGTAVDDMTTSEAITKYYRVMHEIFKISEIFAKQVAGEVSKIFADKKSARRR